MVDLAVKNGRVITPHGVVYGGVAAEAGRIAYVGSDQGMPQARRVIDAQNHFVIPGLIDPHVHLSYGVWPSLEAGLEAQFARETDGALHGGVTTLGHFLTAFFGTSLLDRLDPAVEIGNRLSYVDFFFHANVNNDSQIGEEPELFRRGVTSFKHMFNAYKGPDAPAQGKLSACDEAMLFRSFENIASMGYPGLAMCHCEEIDIILLLRSRLEQAGRNDLLAWTESRPGFVEAMRISHAINIAKATGCPLYIVHISSQEGADLVARARREGLPVHGETCPQYLTLTGDMEREIGCWGKVNPSLKYEADIDALWRHLSSGSIACVATDHASCDLTQKESGKGKHNNIWASRVGICGGMEQMLPIMMTRGVNPGRMNMEQLVSLCSTNTARVFGLYPRKGVLAPGSDADIVIVDPDKEALVDDKFYHCQSEYPVYAGWRVIGMAQTTIVRGKVMMENYETTGKPGHGRFVSCRAY